MKASKGEQSALPIRSSRRRRDVGERMEDAPSVHEPLAAGAWLEAGQPRGLPKWRTGLAPSLASAEHGLHFAPPPGAPSLSSARPAVRPPTWVQF